MSASNRRPVRRVAVLAPHPDDEVLGCASVLTECDVVVVHATDGVPVDVVGAAAVELAATRAREARDASAVLGARVEQVVALHGQDQRLWRTTGDIAAQLVELLAALEVDAVYAPAWQCGHPDHDGLYVAAQLARDAAGIDAQWWCYALYALDDQGRPGYGWLDPGLFPDVVDRTFSAEDTERKASALRAHVSQVLPGSVVQDWIDAPRPERFAPMPRRDVPIPRLRSYYDEVFRFAEQGIDRDEVDRVLLAALTAA